MPKEADIQLLIVDDHPLWAQAIFKLMVLQPFIGFADMASSGEEALKALEQRNWDVVLLDIEMPGKNGIEVCKIIHQSWPSTIVIALTQFAERGIVKSMFLNGARGYLLKSTTPDKLLEAFKTIVFDQEIVNSVVVDPENPPQKVELSEREIEILRLVCEQYSSKQIGEMLGISVNTVSNQRKAILNKIGVANTAGMVKWAYTNDII